jgi:hypothetical protein
MTRPSPKRLFDDIEFAGGLIECEADCGVETRVGRRADQRVRGARIQKRGGVVLWRIEDAGLRIVADRINLIFGCVVCINGTSENADIDEMVDGIDRHRSVSVAVTLAGNRRRRDLGARTDATRIQFSGIIESEKQAIGRINANSFRDNQIAAGARRAGDTGLGRGDKRR